MPSNSMYGGNFSDMTAIGRAIEFFPSFIYAVKVKNEVVIFVVSIKLKFCLYQDIAHFNIPECSLFYFKSTRYDWHE